MIGGRKLSATNLVHNIIVVHRKQIVLAYTIQDIIVKLDEI